MEVERKSWQMKGTGCKGPEVDKWYIHLGLKMRLGEVVRSSHDWEEDVLDLFKRCGSSV